jgi:hypothetical protein
VNGRLTREKVLAELEVLAAKCASPQVKVDGLASATSKDELSERVSNANETIISARRILNENWLDFRRAELANMELRGNLTILAGELEATERRKT